MPPKGRGRARGGAGQDQGGPQRPGPQGGQQHPQGQGGGPQGRQEQPPPQRQGPPPGLQQPPPKPKAVAIDPEELGFQYERMEIAPPLPRKPEPGKLGRKIKLISNCYPIDIPSGSIYHYDVEICSKGRSLTTRPVAAVTEKPMKGKETKDTKYRCMSTKRNREVVNWMLEVDKNFTGYFAAYDGRKNLYTRKPLKIEGGQLKCNVVLPDQNPGNPDDPRGPRTDDFEIIIKPVNKKETQSCAINLDSLHALFQGQVKDVPQEAIMALDTVLRHGPCLKYIPVGRSFFYPPMPQDVHPLGGGREIWFGYFQSLRLGQWKPMINLDITATTFYQSGPVLQFIAEILNKNPNQMGNLRDFEVAKASKELRNMQIQTNHLRNYKRKYRILRLTRETASTLQFSMTVDGKEVKTTVANYFAKHYFPLKHPNLPCIQGNPEAKKVYLPLEVCDLVEGQHCKKKLEDRQNAEMIKFTARAPKQRFKEINTLFNKANYNQDKYLKEFGFRVYKEPLQLEGRVLDAPNVRYLNETKVKPRDGSWDMRDIKYFRGAVIESWVLLSFADQRFCPSSNLERFAKMLCEIASQQGIQINRPATIQAVDVNRNNSVYTVLHKVQKQYNANLAVVVVPGRNKAIYGEVKQAAETILGLVTQCIKDESVVKKCNPPLVSNLCQKINAKAGGVNNSLTPGETPAIFRRPVIIIGADVTHPGPSGDNDIKPSIAAAVGSLDSHPSRYAVTVRAQKNKDAKKQSVEIILELKSMIIELLKAFYKSTRGKKPEKIIFYRDGVSEGQFDQVRHFEVKCIREACATLSADYQPEITFIVVQKRHHTRFMPEDERQGTGRMKNIPPGTTVDNTVVHPLNYDFFLCSHFGLQGTSRPCHYTVIEDDNNFTADDLQKLTYYLCHTYVRCTKSISSPAPVMYAHLAAFRARQHLLTQMDESSAGSSGSSSTFDQPLPEAVIKAIQIKDGLSDTMYFV